MDPNIFDPKSNGTHNGDKKGEEVIMWDKNTGDVGDIWSKAHAVTKSPSPELIPTKKIADSIDAVIEVDFQMDYRGETEAVTSSENLPLVIKMESVCINGSVEDM